MNFIKSLFFAVALVLMSGLQATVGQILTLKSPTGGYCCFFLDWHVDHEKGFKQHHDFMRFARRLKPYVITEDYYTYRGANNPLMRILKKQANTIDYIMSNVDSASSLISSESPRLFNGFFLPNIIFDCEQRGIRSFNAECRHVHIHSEGKEDDYVLSAHEAAQEFKAARELCKHELAALKKQETSQKCDLIAKWCAGILAGIDRCVEPYIKRFEGSSKSIYALLQDGVTIDTLYDTELLDIRIVVDLWKNKQEKLIFTCAGGAHIKRILPILKKLGYKEVIMPEAGKYFNQYTQEKTIFNHAPDVASYCGQLYKKMLICSVCDQQCTDEQEYTVHAAACKKYAERIASLKKYAIVTMYAGMLGFMAYSMYYN
ncbi:MAG: hypothetical protein NTX86_00500 [Candidatus Dependentiae bacterium]|nr:hypothetical protein [Candidatus Dependentiae bacterium]